MPTAQADAKLWCNQNYVFVDSGLLNRPRPNPTTHWKFRPSCQDDVRFRWRKRTFEL